MLARRYAPVMPGIPHGVFPPGSIIRRVDSEAALILGGGRALLLQLAHPSVAQGVADHSDFRQNPLRRLMGTLDAMYTIVFGSTDKAEAQAEALDRVHSRVTGPGYEANDPDLKMWVHATLVDTAIRVHRRFLTPLRRDEECEYYEQSMILADLLGVPREVQPSDYAAFRALHARRWWAHSRSRTSPVRSQPLSCGLTFRGRSYQQHVWGAKSASACALRPSAANTDSSGTSGGKRHSRRQA